MDTKQFLMVLATLIMCMAIVVESQYYGRSRYNNRRYGNQRYSRYNMMAARRRQMMMRQPMRQPRGQYFSGQTAMMPSYLPQPFGYHDNGLDGLLRRRYRNPMMQRRHNYGVLSMFGAESLGCKTLNDVSGPDFAHYQPSRCSAAMSCMAAGSGRPKQVQVGSVCMCCPAMVTNGMIAASANTRGRERYYDKVNTFDPTEHGMSSDLMQDRMAMMGRFAGMM